MSLIHKIIFMSIFIISNAFAKNSVSPLALSETSTQLKATYIYNLLHYVTKQGHKKNRKNFTICLHKREDLFQSLKKYEHKKINKMELKLKKINDNKACLRSCQMVILPKLNDTKLKTFIKKAKNRNVITLSDVEGCAKKGIMIYLKDLTSKIEFKINLKEMQKANVKLSSRILKLSTIVER